MFEYYQNKLNAVYETKSCKQEKQEKDIVKYSDKDYFGNQVQRDPDPVNVKNNLTSKLNDGLRSVKSRIIDSLAKKIGSYFNNPQVENTPEVPSMSLGNQVGFGIPFSFGGKSKEEVDNEGGGHDSNNINSKSNVWDNIVNKLGFGVPEGSLGYFNQKPKDNKPLGIERADTSGYGKILKMIEGLKNLGKSAASTYGTIFGNNPGEVGRLAKIMDLSSYDQKFNFPGSETAKHIAKQLSDKFMGFVHKPEEKKELNLDDVYKNEKMDDLKYRFENINDMIHAPHEIENHGIIPSWDKKSVPGRPWNEHDLSENTNLRALGVRNVDKFNERVNSLKDEFVKLLNSHGDKGGVGEIAKRKIAELDNLQSKVNAYHGQSDVPTFDIKTKKPRGQVSFDVSDQFIRSLLSQSMGDGSYAKMGPRKKLQFLLDNLRSHRLGNNRNQGEKPVISDSTMRKHINTILKNIKEERRQYRESRRKIQRNKDSRLDKPAGLSDIINMQSGKESLNDLNP